MFGSQISKALLSDPHVGPEFLGVFPSDKLPKHISYPCSLVVNTDPSFEKGEHWVCYYFDSNGNAEYFDSYGFPPSNCELFKFLVDNGNTFKCNNIQLQGLKSKVCGHYCIAYLASRSRGVSMDQFVNHYQSPRPGSKDQTLADSVNRRYNIKSHNQIGGGGTMSNEQCCCSRYKKHSF